MKSSLKTLCFPLLLLASNGSEAAMTINGNANTGFGGPVGNGSLSITDNGTNLTFTYNRGSGDFNDSLVLYFDSISGGAASLPATGDIGDPWVGRRAIVNEWGSGMTFPSLFSSDFAFVLKSNGSAVNHMFTTPSGANANTVGFVSTYTVSNFGSINAASYSWSVPVTDLGLTADSGATFKLVTTYLNPNGGGGSDASFRSDEAFGYPISGGSPGFNNFTAPSAVSYTIIPEPSAALLGGLGLFGLLRRRRG